MARKAPGKAYRKGLTLLEIADMFRDEDESREWIEQERWQGRPHCPECGSLNVQCGAAHPRMTHRCRDCPGKPFFSVRKGSVMEGSNLPYRVWAVAIYLFTTNIKGISSMKLHRELGISQKSAWFLLHRLRHASETGTGLCAGPVEADEAYMGGKRLTYDQLTRDNGLSSGARPSSTTAHSRNALPSFRKRRSSEAHYSEVEWVFPSTKFI